MFNKQSYFMAFSSSHLLCSIISMLILKTSFPIYMYLFMLLPIGVLISSLYLQSIISWDLLSVSEYLVLIICAGLYWSNERIRAHMNIDTHSLTALIFLVAAIVIMFTFPIILQNELFGLRTYITMNYPEVWDKAHKATSVFVSWTIIPLALLVIYLDNSLKNIISIGLMVITFIISVIYTVIIGRPIAKDEYLRDKKELDDQIKKEQGYR